MRLSNFWVPAMDAARRAISQSDQTAASLATALTTMLDAAVSHARQNGFPEHDVRLALFAVVAWIDEFAMSHAWPGEPEWRQRPLQRTYFSTTRAGAAFFEKLDALPDEATDVQEVFALVLLAGFQGRYTNQPAVDLQAYRQQLCERVACARAITPLATAPVLFPETRSRTPAPAPYMRGLMPSLVGLLVMLIPVLLLLCLYLFLDFRLSSMASDWVAPFVAHP